MARIAGTAVFLVAAASGCSRHTGPLAPWPGNTDPVVFQDAFPPSVIFQAFAGSKYDAVSVDSSEKYLGTACLKVHVPGPGDPSGPYAGGAFTATQARELSGYDALTFWARASRSVSLDVAGLGNDNTGTSKFEAKSTGLLLTTTWKQFVIPIPRPSRLTAEKGLFFFSAGPKSGTAYDMWFDEVRFEHLGTITNPRPLMTPQSLSTVVGTTVPITGTQVTFKVNGVDQVVQHMPGYFTFASSNPKVATISSGIISVIGSGGATVTATLDTVPVVGALTLDATVPPSVPAPTPTVPASDVISLFSNAYTNVTVDTWAPTWTPYTPTAPTDLKIAGDDAKLYTNLSYAAVVFEAHQIDATAMKFLHMDIWAASGTVFKIKLVDFGADGNYGTADDSQYEIPFTASSTPALVTGTWDGLEIPLADFQPTPGSGLLNRAHLAQLIFGDGDTRTVYVDNVYFHK